MHKPPPIGSVFEEQIMARPEDLASAVGNPGVHVVSSPATILFIEMVCHRAMASSLAPGEGTVGVDFVLHHARAARLGAPLDVRVELIEIDDNKLRFAATATQNGKTIMNGEHQRALIDLDRLLKRSVSPRTPRWTFWYSLRSPWSLLAAREIGELARKHQAVLQWQPLLRGADDRSLCDPSPAYRRWARQDLHDHAARAGVRLLEHDLDDSAHEIALRVALLASERGVAEAFVTDLMDAFWIDGRSIDETAVLVQLGAQAGLSATEIHAAMNDQRLAERLEALACEAERRGIFAAPSVETDRTLYYGYDRLDRLDRDSIEVAASG